MSEQIEELEKQALAIQKRIAELKAANTTTCADEVIEELKQPGTYMYIKGSCHDTFIIHPECKYRQATKKSVEFCGKSFYVYGGRIRTPPTVISWSSCGIAVNDLKRSIEAKDFVIMHSQRRIIDAMGKAVNEFKAALDLLKQIVNSAVDNRCKWVETDVTFCPENFVGMRNKNAAEYVVKNFDGLVLCEKEKKREYLDETCYYIFNVTETNRKSYLVNCVEIRVDNRDQFDFLPIINESYVMTHFRTEPYMDSESAKQLSEEIKSIVNKCRVASVDELKEIVNKCESKSEDACKKFTDEIKLAIGYTK